MRVKNDAAVWALIEARSVRVRDGEGQFVFMPNSGELGERDIRKDDNAGGDKEVRPAQPGHQDAPPDDGDSLLG
eukprot:9483507-Pyramimonas_sp.AAC.1